VRPRRKSERDPENFILCVSGGTTEIRDLEDPGRRVDVRDHPVVLSIATTLQGDDEMVAQTDRPGRV
jgi:hypothetical protein